VSRERLRVVVLISGRGSNLQAIIDASRNTHCPFELSAVISNRPQAPGLIYAERANIATRIVDHKSHAGRENFDNALVEAIDTFSPGLVVLAGFMRILTPAFVEHYDQRLINIHPSLLPLFPGLDTHQRAITSGAREHGASVHFVSAGLDSGPLIAQARVPILPGDDADALAARVLEQEHKILPEVIGWYAEGRVSIEDGRVLLDGQPALPTS
jgi:phosphoribosylglycinamide formyltransferase-1